MTFVLVCLKRYDILGIRVIADSPVCKDLEVCYYVLSPVSFSVSWKTQQSLIYYDFQFISH